MRLTIRRTLYFLFFVSGFCSLVYQVVWTRLAFASFGIITPVLSVVLSVFMLGLSLGSWGGGKLIGRLSRKTGLSAIFFYGGAELIIGFGAFATPALFDVGQNWLLAAGQMDSLRYLVMSAVVLGASILPWCICMGATFPCMMAYVREEDAANADSFSFLYFANVLGAMAGTIITALVLVEMLGFHHTLAVAAAGNFTIAALSVAIGWQRPHARVPSTPIAEPAPQALPGEPVSGGLIRWILFTTGFCSMALEVVWTRAFTPVLKTQVYSFAMIVFAYLGATFFGSMIYRRDLRQKATAKIGELMALVGLAAFFPIVALDPRILPTTMSPTGNYEDNFIAVIFVLGSICPICMVLGYLTPSLIDRYASGHPAAAGKAYGINVIGCILGPLFASYFLLPHIDERRAMVVLGLPLLGLAFLSRKSLATRTRLAVAGCSAAVVLWCLLFAQDFDTLLRSRGEPVAFRRDYAASVVAFGSNFERRLLVNGVGMTTLTPETKYMVHLPMALHEGPVRKALLICFGMGTSFRASLSWGVQTTAVELVPGVVDSFGFYHPDTAKVLANPLGNIVIDDGRRFLKRTREKYDIIVVEPPPPIEAAGSSLLFSREFYELAKMHLNTNGILQMWCPEGPRATLQAVARSVADSFPYTRTYFGFEDYGTHFLGSMQPIKSATAAQLCGRLPDNARNDFMEWMRFWKLPTLLGTFNAVVTKEAVTRNLLDSNPAIRITDDQPFNEYYLLRKNDFYKP